MFSFFAIVEIIYNAIGYISVTLIYNTNNYLFFNLTQEQRT
jgi:hypothetical protein